MNAERPRQQGRARLAAVALATLALLLPPPAARAHSDVSPFKIDNWRTEDGLQQNTIKSLGQTPDGYLWIGTRFGLARYNGSRFVPFDQSTTPGLADDNSVDMAVDRRDGSLWVLSLRNLIHRTAQGFRTLPLGGPERDTSYRLEPSRQGGVWIATEFGLLHTLNGTPTHVPLFPNRTNTPVRALLEDDSGHLWLSAPQGLFRFDPATRQTELLWETPAPTNQPVLITALAHHSSGGLWIGSATGELYHHHQGRTTRLLDASQLGPGEVLRLLEASDGTLWIVGNRSQLFHFEDSTLEPLGGAEGLSDEQVFTVFEDREANLWVGTEAGGLFRLQRRQLRTVSVADGLINDQVWSICTGRDDTLWFGTKGGVSRLRGGEFVNHRLGEEPEDNLVMSVREDHRGVLWVGTKGRGLKRLENGRLTTYRTTDWRHDQINGIYEDPAGTLWVSTLEGLFEMRDDRIVRRWTTADGLPDNEVRAVHQARDGTYWIATRKGLVARRNDTLRVYTEKKDGLADDFGWCLHEDPDGGIWIGSEYGLTWHDGTGFYAFTTQHGLFDKVINDIMEDDQGNLWIGCNRGIFRIARRQFSEFLAGDRPRLECQVFGLADGMLHSETNGEHQPSACRTPDGSIWFPTVQGAVVVPPNLRINQLPPPVLIEELFTDRGQVTIHPGQTLRLPPGSGRQIELHYTANSLVDPGKVRFRYQLKGFDKEPQFDDGRRRKLYTNLQPGAYEFIVHGCNNHGVWSQHPATLAFVIQPFFYQTKSFYALSAAVLAAIAYGLHRRRLNVVRHINRLEQAHAVEGERRRIASEMHDELGSHLTQIALLGEMAARELPPGSPGADPVRQMARASRTLFRAMDEVVWAVNPRHDTIDAVANYLSQHAQSFLSLTPIRCRLELPDELPPARVPAETRHNLFLAFKEALNNVVRHANASEVLVSLHLHSHAATLALTDNGRGFDPASVPPGGNGLTNIQERLARCGGTASIASTPGRGTTVRLTFRLLPEPDTP